MAYPYGGINAVALGTATGSTLQGLNTVALGYFAGVSSQGAAAVALGSYAGQNSQPASSIVINATGSTFNGAIANAFYAAPLRNIPASTLMQYDPVNREVVYSNTINATLTVNTLNYSTLVGSTITTNTMTVGSTITASTINSINLTYSTLRGSTVTANTVIVNSTLSGSSIITGSMNYSTLTGSTMFVTNFVASTITGSSIFVPGLSFSTFSSLVGCTITASSITASSINFSTLTGSTMFVTNFVASTITGSSIFVPGLSFSTFSSLVGCTITTSTISASTILFSSMVGSSITVSSINFSSMSGSTFYSLNATLSTLIVSSITGVAFGATGPTGPIGQVAMAAFKPTSIQNIAAATPTPVNWATVDSTQSTGSTGFTYNGSGQFTNNNLVTVPVLIEYTLMLDATGGGSTYISLNGAANYAQVLTTTNQITNSFTLLVPPTQSFYVYYTDNSIINIQTSSRISLTLLTAGQQGVTGPTGTTGPTGPQAAAALLSYTASGSQVINSPSILVAVTWNGSPDATQSTGTTGLSPPSSGLFTNNTNITLSLLVEYTLSLNNTFGGYSAIGLNGSTALFGGAYNDSNAVSNSCTVLVPAGQTIGLYYMDNGSTTIQSDSRITFTVLMAGQQGATGCTGPTGPTGPSIWTVSGSNISYTTGIVTASSFTASTMTAGTINYNTLLGASLTASTITLSSTIVSLGQSTNQSYYGLSYGAYTNTLWGSTLNTLTSNVKQVAMGSLGQYQVAVCGASTANSVYVTQNSGQTWSTLSAATGLPLAASTLYTSGALSATGQYGILATNGGYAYVTNNSGATYANVNPNVPAIYLPLDTVPANSSVSQGTSPATLTVSASAPTSVPGIVGANAIRLANTASSNATQYIRGTWTPGANYTVSFWFNAQTINGTQQNMYSSHGGANGVYITTTNYLGFFAGGANLVITTFPIILNTWYNITAIFQSSGTGYFYVNNVLIGSATCASSPGTPSGYITIGGNDAAPFTAAFNGYIDDLKIYNSAIPFNPMVPMNYNLTAVSGNGQYMVASVSGGGLFMSSNFGSTWSQVQSVVNQGVWTGLCLSYTGQYIAASQTATTAIVPQLTGLTGGTGTSSVTTTWTTNGVTWTSSASSSYSVVPDLQPWAAFNNVAPTSNPGGSYSWISNANYNSGTYNNTYYTTVSALGNLYGEWLQLQSSIPLVMYTYTFGGAGYISLPKNYYIVGSNDRTTWYPIHSCLMAGNPNGSENFKPYTSYITVNYTGNQTVTGNLGSSSAIGATTSYSTSTNAYTYFRLIINSSFSAPFTEFTEWFINFYNPGQFYSTNYGSNWTSFNNTSLNSILAISDNGQYSIGANAQTAYIVSNYLAGFSTSSYTTPTLTGINANIVAAAISGTGSCQVIVTSGTTNNLYYSMNSGATFLSITLGSTALVSCTMSDDGSYITAANATTVYTLNYNGKGFSLAVGSSAGAVNQAQNAIALGNSAGQTNQTANSIILNASGAALNSYSQGFYVAPIAAALASSSSCYNVLGYGADNQIVQSGIAFSNSQQIFYGEWVQLQLATAVNITGYQLLTRLANNNRFAPAFALVGSTDGINWTVLDTQYAQTSFGIYTLKSVSPLYSYFRIIFTQHSTSTYIDLGAFILYNGGNTLFSSYQNYSVVQSGNYNIMQYNAVTVCTVSWSWANTDTPNAFGIAGDGTSNLATFQPGFLATPNGYTINGNGYYFIGYRTVSSYYTPTQGTATTANTSTLSTIGNVVIGGALTATTDAIAQGIYLTPSAANSSLILQYIQKVVNTITPVPGVSPWWANVPLFSAGPPAGGSAAYFGGVLLPNGNVVFAPYASSTIGIYNPTTTLPANAFTAGPAHGMGNSAYFGGVLLPNGNVIFIPYNTSTIGIYNPTANTFTSGPSVSGNAYAGGVLLPNGNVVFFPFGTATNIGIYNPTTNTFTLGPTHGMGTIAYFGGVLLPNGNVVLVPHSATAIGIYNPTTNTFTSGPTHGGGVSAYLGGVLLPNGNVVLVPHSATAIGIYNPTTNTFSTGPSAGGSYAYQGGVLLPNGNVVFVPYNATTIGIYNPTTNTFTSGLSAGGSGAYAGGVLLPNGNVVIVPNNATSIGILTTNLRAPTEMCLSPYFNKL